MDATDCEAFHRGVFLGLFYLRVFCLCLWSAERAKTFWAEEDVDQAFSGVFEYLDHLKRVLQKKTATDKGADSVLAGLSVVTV